MVTLFFYICPKTNPLISFIYQNIHHKGRIIHILFTYPS